MSKFPTKSAISATAIEDFSFQVFEPSVTNLTDIRRGKISYQILWADGRLEAGEADLFDILNEDLAGQTHLTNLTNLIVYLKSRLVSEVLPPK